MSAGTQQLPIPWTPAPPQLVMAYSVCKGITRTAAKNFYYAFLVLPRRKREALCAVYAFMRRCDDITDDASLSLLERRQKLDTWLAALHRAQQGEPTDDAILLALTDAQRRFSIPAGLLDELALGTAMDIEDAEASAPTNVSGLTVQYRTFEDLRLYCYRVASVVGLVCIHVFGYRDPAAEPLAERCGLAFQLTNIIRDVKEDAGLGRIYLPEEDLAKFNLSFSELLATPDPARFRPVLALEADRAREFYASGEALIPYVAEDSQPALWVLVTIYRRLLDRIAEKQYDVFTAKVSLSRWEKLRILGKGFIKRIL
ncbi:MAG TPA: phytoene/squalene synthase family protein [Candidatus Sulfotelmatobacter sp.]|nr:phytoene/squalene synthase family protein [Candidatus Sulfotelmatobacter sp.]